MKRTCTEWIATLAASVTLAGAAPVLAGTKAKAPAVKPATNGEKAKARKREKGAPARATGLPASTAPPAPAYRGDTIRMQQNHLGQTVYSISPSRFDVSPPLHDLAATAPAPTEPAPTEEDHQAETHPLLPSWRRLRSGVRDPVVQSQIAPVGGAGLRGAQLAAPTTGFNFVGIGWNGGSPSDCNGSVGNDQFVETVNSRYQVWSLNRATSTATSILGPAAINTLWAGFGGACQTQNSGDPIVIFDKVANRWLISQFTSNGDASGIFYQCVAVSTTPDAIGTYFRWAFAVPDDPATNSPLFGDYPHISAWTDAYYMMAHAFGNGYVGALFAAMDRAKMLQGVAAATWQVILDTSEGGHMPADLDGFTPPPTSAPGIFLSLNPGKMNIYRMKVDFAAPANTANTRQAAVTIADATGACEQTAGPCIPQPGSTRRLDSLGDRLMFRAAYRNFLDHESLVVTHSVDPSITGVESGVRWYDLRLSGTPDAVCASYPCVYQQGTFADVPGGRSRWMGSVAMDTAENLVIGYSTTGTIDLTDNHSIRYTGRAKNNPPGTMTVPEVIIATGNRNTGNLSRWGDYSSMSVDPADDCTLWYVSQYYSNSTRWTTQVASMRWPQGNGPGECPATTCTSRPVNPPLIGTATVLGPNQIQVTWNQVAPAAGAYAVERATGACGSEGLYQPLGAVPGTATSYIDTTVQGGLQYCYRVKAASDAAGKCQGLTASNGVAATATGACNLKPLFAGATTASSTNQPSCGLTISWSTGTSSCPLTPNLRYNIYRGSVPDFVPGAANRIATCRTGSSYLDTTSLTGGRTYYYLVRAEDDSSGNGGDCGGGNQESNGVVVPGTAYGAGTRPAPGTWTDGGGDTTAFLLLNAPGPGNTADATWRFVATTTDAGANHTPGGAYAYRNAGPSAGSAYASGVCSEMQTPELTAGTTALTLQYWERHQMEYHWDGVAVEYSVNGGPWSSVAAPSNSPAAGCAATDDTTDWQNLECTQTPPVNACNYPAGTNLYNGPLGGGAGCNGYITAATPSSYAHRCHPVTGLTVGDKVLFRWRFTSDGGAQFAGFYLDDIAVSNVRLPNACNAGSCAASVAPVELLLAAKATVRDDIDLSWTLDPAARGYNVWYVTQKKDIPVANQANQPLSKAVGGCAVPTPATGTACTDFTGVSRDTTNPFFYQVRSYCDATTEGP